MGIQFIYSQMFIPPPMAIFPLFLISFLLSSLLLWFFLPRHSSNASKSNPQKTSLPPSPPKLPIIGNLHQLGKAPHISLQLLSQELGPIIYLKLGQIPTVIVSSAKLAKELLKNNDPVVSSRPRFYSAKHLMYNCTDIAYSPYGSYWRHVRKICILELLNAKRVQYFGFVREEEVANLVTSISSSCAYGPVNLSKKLARYANNVICKVAFGKNYSEGEYGRHGFHEMLLESQIVLGGYNVGDFFPSMEWINVVIGFRSRVRHLFHRFDRFLDEVIEEHLDPNREETEHKYLVDVLLDIHKNGSLEMPLTRDNVKALIMDMFAAGTDTTFVALDWVMTELIKNPRVLQKAQAEVRSVAGHREKVEENHIHQLHYLKAVIKEIFRLHPPVPLLVPRESLEDITINGYHIPAKTRFITNAFAIGRDPQYWEKPLEFEPERFMGNSIDFKGQDFELIPFGAGRRGCPAITFGTVTVEVALAQLLYSFDWDLPNGVRGEDLDMTAFPGITTRRKSDLVVVAKPYFA